MPTATEPYPRFENEVDASVMRGLVPFRDDDYDHENRPPQLPALFEYEGIHPQHPVKLEGCKTLVYLVDPSPEGKARAVRISQAQRVPGIISALPGLLKLKPGYAVLARPITQGGDPNDDCLQVLVSIEFERTLTTRMQQLCRGEYTHEKIVELMDNVKKARDELLGRRDERKKHKVAMFELDDRAKPLTNGPRCYPVNNLVQRSRGIEGPPAALKTYNNTTDDYQEMMRRFVFAITAINIAAMELQGPPGMLTAAKDYGEQVNTPRLGHDRNYHWASQQLNVASARRPAASARDFKTDQGHFSEPHIDKHDLSQGLSAANSIGDTPDDNGCDPGRFHFIGLGVYVELVYGLQIFFSGLLYHGGTPPLIPSPQRIHGWEIRMFVISYPASTILTGEARHSYGSIPYSKDPEFVSPEITGAPTYIREAPVAPLYTNCATIAQDGGVVMPRRSHVNWIVRAALQKLHYTLRQLPPEYGIQIDADSFTDSVKFLSEEDGPDGNLVTADRWALAPDSDVQHPYSARHKQAQDAFLKAENDRLIRGLPTIADNRHSSWDILSLEFNGRPKKSATAKRKRPAVDTPAKPEQSKRPCTRNIARSHVRVNASNTFPMASQPTWRIPNIVVDSHSPSRAQNDSTESPNQQKEQVEPSVGASSSNDLAQTSSAPHTHNTLCTDRETSGQTRRQGDANRAYVLVPPSRLLQHNVSGQKHRVPEGDGGQQGAVVVADPDGGHENEHAASIPPASLSLRSHRCLQFVQSLTSAASTYPSPRDVQPQHTSGEFLKRMLQDLDGLDVAQRHSSSPDYLPSNVLPLCSTATQGVKDFCRGTSHWVNLYRQRIMLTEALMDRSIRMLIDHECPQVVQAHLAESPINTEDWLLTLTKKVAGLVICGLPVTAKSTEFFSEKELTPKVFAEDRRVVEKRKYLTPRKVEGVTLLYMRQILFHWFGSCTPFTSQAQSSFVHCIVSHLGAGALLLPAVWDAYGNIPDWMLASDCPTLHRADSSPDTRFKTEYFAPLSTALATANGLVEARRNLSELQDAYLDLHTRTYSYVQGVIEARTKNASLRRLVKTMSLAVTGAEPALDARLQLISQTLPTVSPRLTSLVEFLKDSYVVAELHANNDKNTPSTPSQQLMFSRPDYYLPLREIAPCRRIQQSSLSRAFAKTRAGLFSLQVFRFVFYNSQAFSTCPPEIRKVEFKTLEEFNQYLETLRTHFRRDDDAFFCDKQALGQTITQRSTSRAADYWTLSNRADFTWPPSRGFMTTWEDLHILKRSLGEENKHLWAGVGPLSTYLFVADMHFAGLLDAPEIDDIGNIIASLQKGAMAGLRKLKYLEEVATRAQVVAAFRQFYEDVEGSLTPQQQEQFSWSPIVAEHTLCKYSRMYGEGYYCG